MSHRIDIELTSEGAGQWTWRAAGARQPKGILDSTLLYPGVRVGDIIRAEADRGLDGVFIVSVTAPKSTKARPETLEVIGQPVADGVSVNVVYADKGRGDRGERGDRDKRPRRDGERPERPARPPRERTERAVGDRPDRGVADRSTRPTRPPREQREGRERPARPAPATKPRRLTASRHHRDALLAALPPEQQPVAEQLFRGGIPAVRQAIIDQNAQLKAAGQSEVPPGPLLALADDLMPRVKTADWLDRAQAALDVSGDLALRDLRQVVTQADGVARDDASREMAAKLREALAQRVESQRTVWVDDIVSSMDEAKLVRAVRLAGRIPDPGAKLPAEVSLRLVTETNTQLSAETPPDRWLSLVEAAADSPFRRDIVPTALPASPSDAFMASAAQASNRIPSLLKLLGIAIPPPPRPKAPAGGRPVPPPPPAPPLRPVAAEVPVEAPAADAPAADAPAAPPAEAPEVEAPEVEAPEVEAPVVEAPVVEAPVEPTASPT